MITEYKVVEALVGLIGQMVTRAIEAGWQPYGSPMLEIPRYSVSSQHKVIQAMVRRVPE